MYEGYVYEVKNGVVDFSVTPLYYETYFDQHEDNIDDNIWKYDTKYAYIYNNTPPTWADGSGIYNSEIKDILDGKNEAGAKYLAEAGNDFFLSRYK